MAAAETSWIEECEGVCEAEVNAEAMLDERERDVRFAETVVLLLLMDVRRNEDLDGRGARWWRGVGGGEWSSAKEAGFRVFTIRGGYRSRGTGGT